jgi:hypothetical protein
MANPQVEAPIVAPPARERLTWKEICARYPDAWVVMIDVEYENGDEDNGELLAGVVLDHSKNSKDCLRRTDPIIERDGIESSSHLFTGKAIVPPGFVSFRLLGL